MNIKDVLFPLKVWRNLFQTPVTIMDPLNERPGAPRYRGFHKNEIHGCIGCGTCESICQNAAIDMVPVEGIETKAGDSGLRPKIDYGRCCWCALCVDVCTTCSLSMSNEYVWIEEEDGADKFTFVPGHDDKSWNNSELGYKGDKEVYRLHRTERPEMVHLHADERDKSFVEIVKGFSKEQAISEANRCVACGLCEATCPAHMNIPNYIKAIRDDNTEEGLRELYRTNPLPGICGRICTHKCETVCAMGHNGDPISIRWLKRYISDSIDSKDYERILGFKEKIEKNGKKVAVVGSGPSGLAFAFYMVKMGYEVTIFESLEKAGGMMRYGIPEYRLPYDQIDKDIDYIVSLGVTLKTNCKIGVDVPFENLKKQFDGVFIATGLQLGRSTNIENSKHENVFQAVDLLRLVTQGKEIMVPEKVVVIGGGNVAFDISRTIARLQKQKYGKVNLVTTSLESEEIMPADREEIVEGREEGINVQPGWGPQRIEIENGKLKGLHLIKCLSVFDEQKRFAPKFDQDQKEFFEADMIVESIGQGMDISYLDSDTQHNLQFDNRGRIIVDSHYKTAVDWLYVGGDIIKGPDVINGIATGHIAARALDQHLIKRG